MLNSSLAGDLHQNVPFTVGQIDPAKGYVHVFDDTTLNIVMSTLDTITDFTAYLTKKEQFLTGNRVILAPGEELLAIYLQKMNRAGEHDFVIEGNFNLVSLEEGFWGDFVHSPERQAQIERDRISYAWDDLIEKFAFHAMTGTQYFTTGQPFREQEVMFRFLAREPRTRRRMLATSLREVLERSIHSDRFVEARVGQPTDAGFPHYVFVFLRRRVGLTDEEYRNVRMHLLSNYCSVTKLMYPEATHIIGIASEAGLPPRRSEDLIYLDASRWSAKDEAKAKEIQNKFGLLRKVTPVARREYEYPVDHKGRQRMRSPSRNSPCPCGSRKRFKNCHGEGLFSKKARIRANP
jgi:hypothetical protein